MGYRLYLDTLALQGASKQEKSNMGKGCFPVYAFFEWARVLINTAT